MSNGCTDHSAAGHRYKLIALDLDGTLLDARGKVTPRTIDAIHRVQSAGIEVVFATGRNWTESQFVLDEVGHYPTSVFVGGAMVVDTKRRKLLHRTVMHRELASEVCRFFENQGHCTLALQDTTAAGIDYVVNESASMNEATSIWMEVTRSKLHKVKVLADFPHEHTIRVGIVAPRTQTAIILPQLKQTFGPRVVFHSISLMTLGVDVLEVFDPQVSKWQGLLHVAKLHGIDPADVIAVGDDVNDLPMIRNAGLGVAMGNAHREVKAIARRTIGRNDEDGLARFLEELVIKQ
jgi:Cof subfamily protein (haloacid dehalogenase superfamily)